MVTNGSGLNDGVSNMPWGRLPQAPSPANQWGATWKGSPMNDRCHLFGIPDRQRNAFPMPSVDGTRAIFTTLRFFNTDTFSCDPGSISDPVW